MIGVNKGLIDQYREGKIKRGKVELRRAGAHRPDLWGVLSPSFSVSPCAATTPWVCPGGAQTRPLGVSSRRNRELIPRQISLHSLLARHVSTNLNIVLNIEPV